jgi:hypothetical protein
VYCPAGYNRRSRWSTTSQDTLTLEASYASSDKLNFKHMPASFFLHPNNRDYQIGYANLTDSLN